MSGMGRWVMAEAKHKLATERWATAQASGLGLLTKRLSPPAWPWMPGRSASLPAVAT